MSPSTSHSNADRDKTRSDRPTPRFANFSFNKLLGGRHSSPSTKASSPVLATPAAHVQPASDPTPSPVPPLVDDQMPVLDILDVLTHSYPSHPDPSQNHAISIAYAHLAISRLPSASPVPLPDVLAAALLQICSASAPTELRCAGFDLLSTYLSSSIETLSSIDRSTFWLIIKGAGPTRGSWQEWASKIAALKILTCDGLEVDGLQGLVHSICTWARQAASSRLVRPSGSDEDASENVADDDRLGWCLGFLTAILRGNPQSLTSSDVANIVDTFDDIVNEAATFTETQRMAVLPYHSLVRSPVQEFTAPYQLLAISRSNLNLKSPSTSSTSQAELVRPLHRRHPSSTSMSPLTTTPIQYAGSFTHASITPKYIIPAVHYADFVTNLLTLSIIPHSSLSKIITSMTLLVSQGISVLPRLDVSRTTPTFQRRDTTSSVADSGNLVANGTSDLKAKNIELEGVIWEVVRRLLSSSAYTVATARALKRLLLSSAATTPFPAVPILPVLDGMPEPSSEGARARCAEGAARIIRLALRRAAEGRLARHWLSNQSGSYAHSGAPTFLGDNYTNAHGNAETGGASTPPDVNEMLLRAWGKEGEGGAWDVERVSGWLPQACKAWVDLLQAPSTAEDENDLNRQKERVIRECLGIVSDIIDEAVQTDERGTSGEVACPPNLGVVEGRLVGETLMEAIKSMGRTSVVSPHVLQFSSQPSAPAPSLQYTLSIVVSRLLSGHSPSPTSTGTRIGPSSTALSTISPPLPSILLSASSHLQDETLAQLIQWYLAEGLLSPSSSEWLENVELLFQAVGVGVLDPSTRDTPRPDASHRVRAREALSEAVVRIYQEVRDHKSHRTSLLTLCLTAWEKRVDDDSVSDLINGSWAAIGDGIAAGAADDETPSGQKVGRGSPRDYGADSVMTPGANSNLQLRIDPLGHLEVRLRSLLCRVARESVCVQERIGHMQSDSLTTPSTSHDVSTTASPTSTTPARASSTHLPSQQPTERESSMPPIMSFLSALASPGQGSPAKVTTNDIHPDSHVTEWPTDSTNPHKVHCRSLSAVLTLIESFQTLAFSPPHSLSSSSANSKTARAPASHQCIHVFRDLLALLTPNTSSPLTETEKEWHERATEETSATGVGQAACPHARLAILQWLVRLRADRDHRLYMVKNVDALLDPYATLLGRSTGTPSSQHSTTAAETAGQSNSKGPIGDLQESSGVRRNRSLTRQSGSTAAEPPHRGREHKAKEDARHSRPLSRDQRNHGSRSRSPPRGSVRPPQYPLWSVPESLPFDVPMGTRPSEGMTTYEAGMGSADFITTSLWLPTSAYMCALHDIIKDETNWDILTYALCQLPTQLSNKHFFCGPMTSRVMVKFAAAVLDVIHSNRLANRLNRVRYPEVLAVAYHVLTVLVSYKRLFNRPVLEAMVEAFQVGLNRYPVTVKPCLHALTLAAFELQPQMTRSLSKIIGQLSQIVTNPAVAIHILELLIILGSIPTLYSNFTEEDYKRVFTVALRYIQHHNRPEGTPSSRGGSHALSQHLLAIAYYTIYVWFLAVRLPERPRHVPHIIRNLLIANDHGRSAEVDEPTEVCFDWLARYTYGDADPKPTRSFLGEVLRGADPSKYATAEKTWIQGNSLVTIRSLTRAGWVEVECRRASGLTRFHCRLENVAFSRLCIDAGEILYEAGNETPRMMIGEAPAEGGHPDTESPQEKFDQQSIVESKSKAMGREQVLVSASRDAVVDPSFLVLQVSPFFGAARGSSARSRLVPPSDEFKRTIRTLDRTPVIDSHTIGILYAAPGQITEQEILGNRHGSPAYTRFLQKLGRLIRLKDQKDVYTGGLDTYADEDGPFAYAWWSDIAQILYHTATMMPNRAHDIQFAHKKKHVGNDYVRIIWNDSGVPFRFDTLKTEFQFANVLIEPHSAGAVGAYSNSIHEHEFFRVCCQRAQGMPEFGPLGEFKLVSAEALPLYVREISLLADFFAPVWVHTHMDTQKVEYVTNWRVRLQAIKRLRAALPDASMDETDHHSGLKAQEHERDFTRMY